MIRPEEAGIDKPEGRHWTAIPKHANELGEFRTRRERRAPAPSRSGALAAATNGGSE